MNSRVAKSSSRAALPICLARVMLHSDGLQILLGTQLSAAHRLTINKSSEVAMLDALTTSYASNLHAAHIANMSTILADKASLNIMGVKAHDGHHLQIAISELVPDSVALLPHSVMKPEFRPAIKH